MWGPKQPKYLFLVDGAGALLSVLLLGFVLPRFESFFGIPKDVLYLLASIPVLFLVYDLLSFQFGKTMLPRLLRGIGILNLLYCLLSLSITYLHKDSVTIFGWIYVCGEIFIVAFLALVELRTARNIMQ